MLSLSAACRNSSPDSDAEARMQRADQIMVPSLGGRDNLNVSDVVDG